MSGLNLNMNTRTLALVLCGVAVFIGAAGWLLVVGPKRSHVSKLDSAIQSKQTQVATLEQAQAVTNGAHGASAQTLGTALPDSADMPQVVDQLNRLAARAGVTLDTVRPSTAAAGVGYEAVPINVVVDGHYFAVERFLHLVRTQVALADNKLHAKGRLFDVQGVQLQQTEPAPMVTATLDLRTFYYSSTAAPVASTTTTSTDSATTG